MTHLTFKKPAKVVREGGFDGGPPGGYVPQMSKEDEVRFRAKWINEGKAGERIEIRKTTRGAQVLIIVAKDGWNYKNEVDSLPAGTYKYGVGSGTKGLNVRVSVNGPLLFTWEDWNEFNGAINEAWLLMGGVLKKEDFD